MILQHTGGPKSKLLSRTVIKSY